jgi:protein-tyrosine phosphatase
MSQILPRLWLGSIEDARHHGFIQRKKITHILCCAEDCLPTNYPFGITSALVPMIDDTYDGAEAHIRKGVELLDYLFSAGHTVLVHCMAGISRSATVVIAWLILYRGMCYDAAYAAVSAARPIIRPNDHFMQILQRLSDQRELSNQRELSDLRESQKQS